MAAIVRHGTLKTHHLAATKHVLGCCYATKAEKKKGLDRRVAPKIQWSAAAQSLASRGFLRPQKEYTPPTDVAGKLDDIVTRTLGKTDSAASFASPERKYKLLEACFTEFQHGVPNSLLHQFETVDDVRRFYTTPVSVATPLDKLATMDLPPNLHIQYDYHRFHPDTVTMFGGVTAFPGRSTLVTGLKYKDKYKGHIQTIKWKRN